MADECYLCGKESGYQRIARSSKDFYNCPCCGKYCIYDDFGTSLVEENKYLIAGFLFETQKKSSAICELTAEKINDIINSPLIPKSTTEKLHKLLLHYFNINPHIGYHHIYGVEDGFAMGYARNKTEILAMIQGLIDLQLFDGAVLQNTATFILTTKGLLEAEKISKDKQPLLNVENDAKYDVFISHASEDKADYVDSFVDRIKREGLTCFYDKNDILWGDSLVERINHGLATSKTVVVVISKYFMEKDWPNAEIEAVIALVISKGRRILPLLHNVTYKEMCNKYPLLAPKLSKDSSKHSIDSLMEDLHKVINSMNADNEVADSKVDDIITTDEKPTFEKRPEKPILTKPKKNDIIKQPTYLEPKQIKEKHHLLINDCKKLMSAVSGYQWKILFTVGQITHFGLTWDDCTLVELLCELGTTFSSIEDDLQHLHRLDCLSMDDEKVFLEGKARKLLDLADKVASDCDPDKGADINEVMEFLLRVF